MAKKPAKKKKTLGKKELKRTMGGLGTTATTTTAAPSPPLDLANPIFEQHSLGQKKWEPITNPSSTSSAPPP